jgi:radical SAM protein with 4Fe4S-binding SPASM domain
MNAFHLHGKLKTNYREGEKNIMDGNTACPDDCMNDDIYSAFINLSKKINYEELKTMIDSQSKSTISKYLLYRFFLSLDPIFKSYGLINVNNYIDSSFKKNIFNLNSCEKWFPNKDVSKQEKTSMFGSYYYFGDSTYLLHIEVGLANLHVGIVKYFTKSRRIHLLKMVKNDFDDVLSKFGSFLHTKPLQIRNWGPVWCSIDCGGLSNMSSKEVVSTMAEFGKSNVYNNIVDNFIKNFNNDKSLPTKLKTDQIKYVPYSINFRLTYKCNLRCRHCYNNANSNETIYIDREAASRVINEAYRYGIRSLSLTGGEPFLYPKLALDMFQEAISLGYEKVSIRTNGYWGSSIETAEDMYSKLSAIGFKPPVGHIGISAGEFHSEFLDWNHVGNIATVHHKTFAKPLFIDFECTKESIHMVDEFKQHLKDKGVSEKWYRLNVRTDLALVGRMKDNFERIDKKFMSAAKLRCIPQELFTVEPDGDIYPCCGFNRYIKGLSLGNIYSNSVSEIINNTVNHKPLNLLYEKSFLEIQNELFGENNTLPTQYNSKCEACENCFGTVAT